jgi:hypothetical protein
MSFGNVSVAADDGALRAAMMLVNLVEMLADPQRQALVAQLSELADAAKQHNAELAEIGKREEAVTHREQQAAKHEAALAQRLADVVERERQATAQAQSIEAKRNELEQLRAEMKSWAIAA